MKMSNKIKARIIRKQSWNTYHLLRLEAPQIASQAEPGQFVMVRISAQPHPLLRRPFCLHSCEDGEIEIFFQEAGIGTSLLGRQGPGQVLDLLGPLGHGFRFKADGKESPVALVGGGRGIAPLFWLARALRTRHFIPNVYYGGKTRLDLPLRERFLESGLDVSCATDDGSFQFHGFVTDLVEASLEKFHTKQLFACGPEPMLRKLAEISRARDISAQFSLESIMGCGFGACWGCVKKIKTETGTEWRKICQDGPVFPAEDIQWK